ncbi:uncharacterized protein TNCV_3707131 [Trichonephila clavipes]|nr:uncharacterized protein TNCV_3707131 [Trichonephila clavipes]
MRHVSVQYDLSEILMYVVHNQASIFHKLIPKIDGEHISATERQKEEHVRSSKETFKLPNDGGHRIISKILTGDETYILPFDVPSRQESKVQVFEDDPISTMVKRQRATKKVMYTVFFRRTGLAKAIKLEGQKTVTTNWYTTKFLPEILQEMNVRGLMLHHDNASFHAARLTVP